jgi:K+-transporting ATPase KdpF subunit
VIIRLLCGWAEQASTFVQQEMAFRPWPAERSAVPPDSTDRAALIRISLQNLYAGRPNIYAGFTYHFVIILAEGGSRGSCLSLPRCRVVRPELAAAKALGKNLGGQDMAVSYWIGGIVAFGLLIYLVIAVLKPEIFS